MKEYLRVVKSNTRPKSPLVAELAAIFNRLPVEELNEKLKGTGTRGPKGYRPESMLKMFLASYVLNLDSIAETVRQCENNPSLAEACGIDPFSVPSRPTLSRFFTRLAKRTTELQQVLSKLTSELNDRLPDFGQNIAIDSTTIRTHSNPDRKPVRDQEASWTAKGYRVGYNTKKWSFGYKLHLAVDATYELPVAAYVTSGSTADSRNLLPLLEQARESFDWFRPESVLADKGYDSQANNKAVIEEFDAVPIIPLRQLRSGATSRRKNATHRNEGVIPRESREWKALYAKRTSVERVFGRLKENRRLERHCYRGLDKIAVHALLALITLQATALSQIELGGSLRSCRRKVA